MKLVSVSFHNVLGLHGTLNFPDGKPLLIYGDNVAGKSNIINVLRYCLIPKSRESKSYEEEKRLMKNEILLERNATGSIEIYFQQYRKLYKLYYFFSRKRENVAQTQKLFETKQIELPSEDEERVEFLSELGWKDLGTPSPKLLKEKFIEIGIYPEILDKLISPSNVRTFSEAISGSVVKVPEIIAARVSTIHENTRKYLENFRKLGGTLVLEIEELDKLTKELKDGFEKASKNLSEISSDKIFVIGETAKNLDNLQDLNKDVNLIVYGLNGTLLGFLH